MSGVITAVGHSDTVGPDIETAIPNVYPDFLTIPLRFSG